VDLTASFHEVPPGPHTLRIVRLDDNVVLEAIEIEPR